MALILKSISRVREYFSTLEEKFRISEQPHNIVYIYHEKLHLTLCEQQTWYI